jgi:hypothetical protein
MLNHSLDIFRLRISNGVFGFCYGMACNSLTLVCPKTGTSSRESKPAIILGTPTPDFSRLHQRHGFNNPQEHFNNLNLRSCDGDEDLLAAIDSAREVIDEYKPDVILLAAAAHSQGRVLVGVQALCRKLDHTPVIWAITC